MLTGLEGPPCLRIGCQEGEEVAVRRLCGLDLRLCWICAYAFLIAINNTSLRPVLPSFVEVCLIPP